MIASLIKSRRFAPMFWCQFFAALGDNFLKNALALLVLFELGEEKGGAFVTIAAAIFILPSFVLSALGGELADRFDKGKVAQRVKLAEIGATAVAAAGMVLHSVPVLFAALFLFGTLAALFGPVKYGILPDQLREGELTGGNALIEAGTFLAILIGTIGGSIASAYLRMPFSRPSFIVAAMMLSFSLASWLSSLMIRPTGPAAPHLEITRNPWTSTWALIASLRGEARLWVGAMIVAWFWLVGAVALSLLPTLVKAAFNGGEYVITLCLATFAIGIAIGSLLAARASHQRPNLALVPLGALLMAVFCLDIAWIAATAVPAAEELTPMAFLLSTSGWHMLVGLFGLAVAGGLYIVPSFAQVQAWAAPERRARVVAAVNVIAAGYMTVSGIAVAGAQFLGVTLGPLFLVLGLCNIAAMVLILRRWGKEGVRDLGVFVFKTLFRVEVRGLENMPPSGTRMVIAPNHVSLLDGPLVHAVLPIDAAFAVDTTIANAWWAKPFMSLIRAHLLDPTRPLAARALTRAVADGEPIVIFPEGRITVTRGLMKVYDGAAMIADKADAVVVPLRIDGAERSPFSYLRKTQTRKSWFPKITVTILPPQKLAVDQNLKGRARRLAAGAALQDLMAEASVLSAPTDQTLFQALVEARRKRDTGQRPAVEDPLGTKLGYRKLILSAQILGRKLQGLTQPGEAVGVLLPNSAGVVVTFFALQSSGRVPAMLNFSSGPANVLSACKAAKVETVLTSRAFIERGRLDKLVEALSGTLRIVYLEDIRAGIGRLDKLRGLFAGSGPLLRRAPDDPAVILFTSGSEGTPKGVVLSHRNILTNAAQALARFGVSGEDKVFNVLPVFHSFGLTGGLILPLVAGVPVYMYPSPLHYRIVPELIYQTNATVLFGTDTFLAGYARSAHPYDFHSLRLVLAGAEAVKERTRALYMERFGVRILEGYGVTETAPVLAINTEMANRNGSVGRLSPLMQSRLEPVPGVEEGGRLFVRGPNVMLGYLHADKPGVIEPPAEGWHDTGDIVAIDERGFIAIRGRAKRFAKVGGEMVSLSAVEVLANELWPKAQSAVIALPDPRKGERLILVTTQADGARDALIREARNKGASELMIPAEVFTVDKLPLLATGKTDYPELTELVKALADKKASILAA
ncbi:acyl-[acyl-carrier-protein]-phospholipid O-acyltransferase / long-chain-fatty-acid--[acyl-carrier-protein] ligase [Rhizobiales bacterium GAS188]|nr:acyl-[acyl-carrier-protein]-phospholipid O-acyltransferase / long-chain-fatty-acid--[acyl-carrier-protein] ligase [Rhizobiales bacterium GAS188]